LRCGERDGTVIVGYYGVCLRYSEGCSSKSIGEVACNVLLISPRRGYIFVISVSAGKVSGVKGGEGGREGGREVLSNLRRRCMSLL
jgi:hypothetical protein